MHANDAPVCYGVICMSVPNAVVLRASQTLILKSFLRKWEIGT